MSHRKHGKHRKIHPVRDIYISCRTRGKRRKSHPVRDVMTTNHTNLHELLLLKQQSLRFCLRAGGIGAKSAIGDCPQLHLY